MKKIAYVHTGSFFHLATAADPAVRARNVEAVYWPEYAGDFTEFDSVFLAARCHRAVISRNAAKLVTFLDGAGRKLYVDGSSQVGEWLPGTNEVMRGTNFWAWRTGENLGRISVNKDHPLWQYLSEESVHWHYHAVLDPPATATPLVILEPVPAAESAAGAQPDALAAGATAQSVATQSSTAQPAATPPGIDPWGHDYRAIPGHANALLYYDAGTFPAEIVVSTMDASYHHGSGFMPGATQLLYRMLDWLRD